MAKSLLLAVAPVALFLVPMTALIWVWQSIPLAALASKPVVPTIADAQAADGDFGWDEWEDPCPDLQLEWREEEWNQTSSPAQSQRLMPRL